MRSLLHDAAFQRLEATWRGVQWLLASAGEIEGDLEISLLHLTREELRVHAQPGTALQTRLEAGDADGNPWSLVVGDFAFGPSAEDMDIAARSCRAPGRPRHPARRRRRRRTRRMRRPPDPGRPENLDDATA